MANGFFVGERGVVDEESFHFTASRSSSFGPVSVTMICWNDCVPRGGEQRKRKSPLNRTELEVGQNYSLFPDKSFVTCSLWVGEIYISRSIISWKWK